MNEENDIARIVLKETGCTYDEANKAAHQIAQLDQPQDRTELHEWGSPRGLPKGFRSRILKGNQPKPDEGGLLKYDDVYFRGYGEHLASYAKEHIFEDITKDQKDLTTSIKDAEIEALHRERKGEVWYWQGKGDHIESLTCPILIEAQDFRDLMAERDKVVAEAVKQERIKLGKQIKELRFSPNFPHSMYVLNEIKKLLCGQSSNPG